MGPLIKVTGNILGGNAEPMLHDEETPPCALCGAEHAGVTTPCYLVLRGHYAYLKAIKRAVFMFDNRSSVKFIELKSGRQGMDVDVTSKNASARIVHEDCADLAATRLEALYEVDEEEILEFTGRRFHFDDDDDGDEVRDG